MATVNIKDLYYTKLNKDDETGVEYEDTPKKIAGLMQLKIKPKTNSSSLRGDGQVTETFSNFDSADVEIEVNDISLEDRAILLGKNILKGVIEDTTVDIAPYVAIGFRAEMSNGKDMFVWLYKGQFSEIEDDYKQKEDKVSFQTPKLKATFMPRKNDDKWRAIAREDAIDYEKSIGDNWFSSPYKPITE